MRVKINQGSPILGRKFTVFLRFTLYLRAISKYKPPRGRGAYIWRGDLTEGFFVTSLGDLFLEGLIHRGAHFRTLTVL